MQPTDWLKTNKQKKQHCYNLWVKLLSSSNCINIVKYTDQVSGFQYIKTHMQRELIRKQTFDNTGFDFLLHFVLFLSAGRDFIDYSTAVHSGVCACVCDLCVKPYCVILSFFCLTTNSNHMFFKTMNSRPELGKHLTVPPSQTSNRRPSLFLSYHLHSLYVQHRTLSLHPYVLAIKSACLFFTSVKSHFLCWSFHPTTEWGQV